MILSNSCTWHLFQSICSISNLTCIFLKNLVYVLDYLFMYIFKDLWYSFAWLLIARTLGDGVYFRWWLGNSLVFLGEWLKYHQDWALSALTSQINDNHGIHGESSRHRHMLYHFYSCDQMAGSSSGLACFLGMTKTRRHHLEWTTPVTSAVNNKTTFVYVDCDGD